MRYAFRTLFDEVDASLPQTTRACELYTMISTSIHVYVDGTATGDISLEASNDEGGIDGSLVTHWVPIAGSAATVDVSNPYMCSLLFSPVRWIRAVWTPTAGAGGLTARFSAKGY